MAALLALMSSAMWGVSDFLGGFASRRADAVRVAAMSVPVGIVPLALLMLVIPGSLSAGAVWSALVAGLCGVGGILLLYAVLAAGPMGVMSPLTAVVSAIVPVTVGLVRGERPAVVAYAGMLLAVISIVLVSVEPRRDDDSLHQVVRPRVVGMAVVCGLLIGGYLAALGVAPTDAGLWPVLLSRVVSAVVVLAVALVRFRGAPFVSSVEGIAVGIGLLDAVANATYRLAAQSGLLAVVSVLAALYPAATVILARFYLNERMRPVQQVGMICALVAAGMLALG